MLERTLALRLRPDIDVLFVDETQDLSPLQFELMKMWSEKCVSTCMPAIRTSASRGGVEY